MKKSSTFLVLSGTLVLSATAIAQAQAQSQSNDQLPSAPSAAVAPQPAPPPPKPAEEKKEPAEPKPGAPMLESLSKPKPQAPKTQPTQSQPSALKPRPEEKPPQGQATGKAGDADEDIPTIRTRVEEVNVIFTVTDRRGRFIKDLKQSDFRVVDDKRPAEAIRAFNAETNLPLRVGLLIDASASIRSQFKFEQEAAVEFLNQIIRPKVDKAMVVGFDSVVEVQQDLTNDTEDLSKAIRGLRPGGGTALYDAIYRVARERLMDTGDIENVRRAIILLSDGNDTQSRVTREEAIEMAQRAGVIVYTIGTSLSPDKNAGDKMLERIAEATGGRAFFPFKIQDVANAFSDIQDELRSQYMLAYKPAEFLADGRYRSIEISTPERKLKVRARRGYFAPRQ